jgi:non-ribosomal peptide synthetase component F
LNTIFFKDAITEQQMSMVAASAFWRDVLHDCELDRPLPLPFDRLRVSDESRSGRGASVTFQFGQNLSQAFITYASTHDIKLEHLALAAYYIFLFKLTNGEKDICLVMNTHGRYKPELMAVIGMFVNAIPMRCRFDPNYSFSQFVQHVQTVATNSLEHSYFPLQHILAQHPLVSRPAFLDTFFGFVSFPDVNSRSTVTIGGVKIVTMPYSIRVSTDEIASKYDFSLNIHHDSATNHLSYTIEASLDLFTASTVNTIGERFHVMLEQLFESSMTHRVPQSIYALSITLPDDTTLIESIKNTQLVLPPPQCMHHNFMHRAMEDPQKLAVELDGQSLTYSELLFYTQRLALHLLISSNFTSGDIVCQCTERSISMVSYLEMKTSFLFSILC